MPAYVPNPDAGPVDDLIEALAAEVARIYAEAEEQMVRVLKGYALRELEEPLDAIDRARVLRELREEAERIMAGIRGTDLAAEVLRIAEEEGTAAAVARLGLVPSTLATTSGLTPSSISAVTQLVIDLASRLDAMAERITRWMPDAYQRIVAAGTPNVLLGVETIRAVQRTTTQRILAVGVPAFTDSAGRVWRPGTYAEMATRTSVNRAWMAANLARLEGAGVYLVTIIAGASACRACAQWTGRVLSSDGSLPAGPHILKSATSDEMVTVTVAGSLATARASGWNHPNCRCVVVGVFPGLSIPRGSTYDPDAEAARDRLRALERRVRTLKRQEAAALDDIAAAQLRRRIRRAQEAIRLHIAETGETRKPYRESLRYSDGSGRPPALPAAPRAGTRPPAPRSSVRGVGGRSAEAGRSPRTSRRTP